MSELEQRVSALEARVRDVEDRLAIYQLMCTYAIAVDSLAAQAVRDVYTDDGIYDQHAKNGKPSPPYVGAQALLRVVHSDTQKVNTTLGCAHTSPMPRIEIDGDTATVVGVSQMFVRRGDTWLADRISANLWRLVRAPSGWRAAYRRNRMLDGTAEHRRTLGEAFRATAAATDGSRTGARHD